jgi:hypothetical protein
LKFRVIAVVIIAISAMLLVLNLTGVLGGSGNVTAPPKMFVLWAVLVVLGAFGAFRAVRHAWIHGTTKDGTPVSRMLIIFVVVGLIVSGTLVVAQMLGLIPNSAP